MSYQLNRTDGTLLTDLVDGQIDQNSTNLTLVGRNYTGYGEFFNENFIKLLENFSNTAAPSNPVSGQLWWDTVNQRLQVFDGSVWKASGGPFVQGERPDMVAGDLWIDNDKNQLYAFDGTDTILIGPQYTSTQGVSGFRIGSILDDQSRSRTVAYLFIGGVLAGLFSTIEFTPVFSQRIDGLVTSSNPNGIIFPGFNIVDKDNFKYRGVADSANALVTATGQVRTADSFLPSNASGITTGTLTIQNSGGLTVGLSQNHVQKVVGPRYYFENQLTDHDMSMRVSSSAYGNITVDALYIDASTGRIGIFTTDRLPEYTLDLEGDLRVTGNLLVEGDTTSIDVTTLRVEDKNIEIGKTAEGSTLTATNADNAGLILSTSDTGDKTWTWKTSENAWTSNVNIDISDNTKSLKIGGQEKLSNTSLTNISKALDLDEIGTLLYLNVDNINFNGKTMSSSVDLTIESNNVDGDGRGINITASGDIHITDSQKITGLADPTDDQDAATKVYTDTQIATETIVFSMDITGLGVEDELQDNVAEFLADLYTPSPSNAGKIAKIHTTSYAGATVDGVDIESVKNLSFVLVDADGTLNRPVVQDVTFDPEGASGNVILTPARTLMRYVSNGTVWEYQSTISY